MLHQKILELLNLLGSSNDEQGFLIDVATDVLRNFLEVFTIAVCVVDKMEEQSVNDRF